MGNTVSRDNLFVNLEEQLAWQRALYRDLHQHPEASSAEHETAARIEQELQQLGHEVHRIGGTGLVVVIENGEGHTVLSRADIDALPVTEATGLDYASTIDGLMHACGHDMHIAALLGSVRALTEHRDTWSGTFIALFQPAEETAAGARAMVADGLTERIPKPDVALSQHVMPFAAGEIRTAPGPILSAGDSIKITVHGRGAHGSMPHLAVDPVVLAATIVLRLQTIVSRETQPGQFAVLTVGALNAGTKSNIIADRAELLVNLRTYDADVRTHMIEAIERMVHAECVAARSPEAPTFEYYDQFPLTDNDPEVTARVTEAFVGHFGQEAVATANPATASEDFSTIPTAFGTPYTYWFVGSVDPHLYQEAVARGTVSSDIPANHSPFFAPAIDPTLETATRAHLVAALAYLARS